MHAEAPVRRERPIGNRTLLAHTRGTQSRGSGSRQLGAPLGGYFPNRARSVGPKNEMSRWLAGLRVAVRSIVRRTRVEEELDEEIQHHLQCEIAEGLKAGLSPADAQHAARRTLGNIEHAKKQVRDARRSLDR